MNWNARQHSYEELRDIVVALLSQASSVNQFAALLEHVGREIARREALPTLQTGYSYPGAESQLHPSDKDAVLEIFWDLFRQGILTLGINAANATWPFFRLSRFGVKVLKEQHDRWHFHDTHGYVELVSSHVPDLSSEAVVYLTEASAAYYADCLLSACIMLGVAAECELLKLFSVVVRLHPELRSLSSTGPIRPKVTAFEKRCEALISDLPNRREFEDLKTNLFAIHSMLRIARNEAGHPSGSLAPSREQVYVYLQMFIPLARQITALQKALMTRLADRRDELGHDG